jgi:hypothetical protein
MAQLSEMAANAGFTMPKISSADIGMWIAYGLIGIVVLAVVITGIFFFMRWLKYNKKIIHFKDIAGSVVNDFNDKAMFERVGFAGDYWAKCLKSKKILARPQLASAKNTYFYFERQDGEWLNFRIQNIDTLLKEAKVSYIDEDMRLQRLGIEKNLRERFNKEGFWSKYGTAIMTIFFLLMITICLVILFSRITELVKVIPQLAQAVQAMANAVADVAVKQGSGLVPVNSTLG